MVSLLWWRVYKRVVWIRAACMILPFVGGKFIQQVGHVIAKLLATLYHFICLGAALSLSSHHHHISFASYTLTRIFNCFPRVLWAHVWLKEELIRYVCVVLSGWMEYWTNCPSEYLARGREGWVSRLWFTLSGRLGFGSEKHKCYHKWGWEGNEFEFIAECYCL